MKIVDAHLHLGEDLMFLTDDGEDDVLVAMDANGLEAAIVQPSIVSRDQRAAHERIRRFADLHPGRVYGIACFDPLMDDGEYAGLARWAVKELGFKGIKLHPGAFNIAPSHPAAQKIYRLAEELDIPVMIHTGSGLPNSLPSLCIPVAREHPGLRLVLAHAGGGTFGSDAIVAAEVCPNVFLETSWTTVHVLRRMVERLGERRVMFGSDLLLNIPVELAKYRAIGLSEERLEWCLGRTAVEVFRLV
jgi:predicted TIM-barrel fold metal-dependent hydrolase